MPNINIDFTLNKLDCTIQGFLSYLNVTESPWIPDVKDGLLKMSDFLFTLGVFNLNYLW